MGSVEHAQGGPDARSLAVDPRRAGADDRPHIIAPARGCRASSAARGAAGRAPDRSGATRSVSGFPSRGDRDLDPGRARRADAVRRSAEGRANASAAVRDVRRLERLQRAHRLPALQEVQGRYAGDGEIARPARDGSDHTGDEAKRRPRFLRDRGVALRRISPTRGDCRHRQCRPAEATVHGMTPPVNSAATPWYRQASKLVTAGVSTGAACVSIFSFLYSFGILGKSESHQTIGNLGVAWVGVRPAVDTATAIGDTLHLAATITDKAGAILVGTSPTWSSEKPAVAQVRNDGSVVAMGPGTTTITVAVGGLVARSRVVVRQRVASVDVIGADETNGLTLPELDRQTLRARARDARGHAIAVATAQWRVDDSSVVALDSAGIATARIPGRTIVTAALDGVEGHAALSVIAAPASIELLGGAAQHAPAGRALAQNVVVRVISRRGLPVSGALVTFRLAAGDGALEPASALSDADGRARTSWTLGGLPGRQSLIAMVQQLDSTLVVTAESDPQPANTRTVAWVEHASGAAALPLADPVQLRVTDSSGRVLAEV